MAIKITHLPHTIRNFQRLYEILRVVSRHGFGDIVSRLGLEGTVRRATRRLTFGRFGRQEVRKLRTEERIRLALEELGSTFIKLGQILATRPDLIPMSLVQELRKLHDAVPPFDSKVAKATIEQEIGAKVEDLFAEFDETPIAAASIAQVHRAKLKNGDEVVIKVQRPGLRAQIDADLDLLHVLAEMLEERIPELKRWQPVAIVEEFDKSIHKEIDFGREAHNVKKFARNFAGDPTVYVPKVYDDLSTEHVLTLEFIHGIKMNSEELLKRTDLDRELIAKNGIRFTLTQTFVHGFFHADPHPGNIFVMPGNVICLIDFGMMGTIDQERIDDLLGFIVSVLTKNAERMIRQFQKQGLVQETVNVRALKGEIEQLMDRYLLMEIMKIDVARYIQELFDIITRFRITLPADLLLMGKALATIEGIARDIYPELDPITAIRPYILQIYFRRLADPEFYTRDTLRAVEEGVYFLHRLPKDLRLITSKLRDGDLTVKVAPEGPAFERLVRDLNRAANRRAVTVLVVGLLAVASYLIVTALGPAFVVPGGSALGAAGAQVAGTGIELTAAGHVLFVLGIVGYVIAGSLGLLFLYGMLRSGGQ